MYIKTDKGRDYYRCDKCGKPHSFKIGRTVRFGEFDYCKAHRIEAESLFGKKAT